MKRSAPAARHAHCDGIGVMREKLALLRAALDEVKRASVFKKAAAAEVALTAAIILIEDMVGEIERLRAAQPRDTSPRRARADP